MIKYRFEISLLRQVTEFLDQINPKARKKLFYNIDKAKDKLDPRLFKKVDEIFWEFRTEYDGIQYHLLAFWDKRKPMHTLVIATNGFIKKSDKLPSSELDRAYAIRKKYYEDDEKET